MELMHKTIKLRTKSSKALGSHVKTNMLKHYVSTQKRTVPTELLAAIASLASTGDDLCTADVSALEKPSGLTINHQTAFSTFPMAAMFRAEVL